MFLNRIVVSASLLSSRICKWRGLSHSLHLRTLCSVKGRNRQGSDLSKNYSDTVYLPRTTFPLRVSAARRQQLESSVQQVAGFDSLYAWQRKQDREQEFVLHDGPPYANGRPHIGHAVNKILKDITLRQKLLQGYKVHYIPGWDCHGLPIELKATQENKEKNISSHLSHFSDPPLKIRANARRFAQETIETQKSVFWRWGLLADRNEVYTTISPQYVTRQLHLFIDLYEKGYIYQDYKPVYYSPHLGTSLAEAELEYQPKHISPSVFLALPVTSASPITLHLSDLRPDEDALLVLSRTQNWEQSTQVLEGNAIFVYELHEILN